MFEIGNTLREARARRGLDILECESGTKIRAKYIRAMEEEQFDLMPSPAYVRGFLRTYAEFLDLDGRLMLDEYESRFGQTGPPTEEPARRDRAPSNGPRRRGGPRRGRRTEAQLVWLAIGGVTGVALLVWMGVGGSAPEPVAPIPPPVTKAATVGAGASAPTATAPPVDERVQISVEGVGEAGSWTEVRGRNASGPVIWDGTISAGESKTWRVGRSVWMRVGDPSGLQVRVGDRAIALSGGTGDFILSRTGVRRVSAG